jgi:PTH1 family peptidyl-tRNA hydrolase
MNMKLIVGLGNMGKEYEWTRHNAGFVVLDMLSKRLELEFKKEVKFDGEIARKDDVILLKPTTFMNNSGKAVGKLVHFYKIVSEDLFVVHDDLDIRLGDFKFQKGIGPKVHNGINSIEESISDKNFWRVRIGIDDRTTEQRLQMEGSDYVLAKFKNEEKEVLSGVISKIATELLDTIS